MSCLELIIQGTVAVGTISLAIFSFYQIWQTQKNYALGIFTKLSDNYDSILKKIPKTALKFPEEPIIEIATNYSKKQEQEIQILFSELIAITHQAFLYKENGILSKDLWEHFELKLSILSKSPFFQETFEKERVLDDKFINILNKIPNVQIKGQSNA